MRRQNKTKSWIGTRPQHSGELALLHNFQASLRDHWQGLKGKIMRWFKKTKQKQKPTCFPCANIIIFLYYSNSQRPRRACCTGHPPSKTVFSPEELTTQIDQRDSRQGRYRTSFILPAAHSTWGSQSYLFCWRWATPHPHTEIPFSYLFYLTTLFFTEGLRKPTSTARLTLKLPSAHPHCNHSESCIRVIPFIFSDVGQWITLLCLFSSLHFPIASHFPGAIEALKRRLAFRWKNIEKVRAIRHNAAIHGAHQLLKCHSFFLMTKATEHNRKQTSIITCFQELAGFDFLHKSRDRKKSSNSFKCGFLSVQHSPLTAALCKPVAPCHLHCRLIWFPALPSFCRQEYLLTPASTDHAQQ